jgi:hypothetical protein
VQIASSTAGTTVVRAATDVTVSGVQLHRETNNGHVGDSADAQKTWASTQQQLTALSTLINGFGLNKPLGDDLLHRIADVERRLAQGMPVCMQLNDLMKTAIDQAQKGPSGLSFTETTQLLNAVNLIELGPGCLSLGSPRPQAEDDLVGLMTTIAGMNPAMPEANDLTNRARDIAKKVVDGNATQYCIALGDLAKKIVGDTGKPNKLTAAQGATLAAAVAAISGELGC